MYISWVKTKKRFSERSIKFIVLRLFSGYLKGWKMNTWDVTFVKPHMLVWVLSNLMNRGSIMFKTLPKSQDPKWRTMINSRITLSCYSNFFILYKNLDMAVDMVDGERSVRSAKYELPLYNKTNKVKYLIGSVHLTALKAGAQV